MQGRLRGVEPLNGTVDLYWSNASGTAVVAGLLVGTPRGDLYDGQFVNVAGLFGPRGFTELPMQRFAGASEIMNNLSAVAF